MIKQKDIIRYMILVGEQEAGLRLDKFLALKCPELSRSRVQMLIEDGNVCLQGGLSVSSSLKTKVGQSFEITIPPLLDPYPQPENIPLDIVYEDQDLLVVNKMSGMVVHPAPGNLKNTLVNALLGYCEGSLSGINGVKRPGIVHRLDKGTSGLLVVAKNDHAHRDLAEQLSHRHIKRVYYALVWGVPSPLEGKLEGNIGRDPRNRKKMMIRVSGGKIAIMNYKVLEVYGRLASLLECRLETGRTHQIRVQLSTKGHPLLGDPVYGRTPKGVPLKVQEFLKSEEWSLGRQALHSKSLSFVHPVTEKQIIFEVSLPKDMRQLIDVLELVSNLKTKG